MQSYVTNQSLDEAGLINGAVGIAEDIVYDPGPRLSSILQVVMN